VEKGAKFFDGILLEGEKTAKVLNFILESPTREVLFLLFFIFLLPSISIF
jgi:hypothetical protein